MIAIQTAEFPNSVALLNEKGNLIEERIIEVRGKTEKLLGELINDLLKKNKIALASIQTVAVCLGPGSYTGLRAGLAFAKGLCQFSGINLIGIDIFEAFEEKGKKGVFLLDAKNRRVYYKKGEDIKVDTIKKALEDLKINNEMKLFGNGAKENESFLAQKLGEDVVSNNPDDNVVNAEFIGHAALKKEKTDSVFELKPIYVQEANITIKEKSKS